LPAGDVTAYVVGVGVNGKGVLI